MTILSKEAVCYDVSTALAIALKKRIEVVTCLEDDFKMVIDRRWRLHLNRETLDEFYDAMEPSGAVIRELFDKVKCDQLEFISYHR